MEYLSLDTYEYKHTLMCPQDDRWEHHSRKAVVRELLLQHLHKLLPNLVLLVVALVLVPLVDARVSPDRAHVDHAVAELHKGASLHGQVEVGNVVQDELHQPLVLVLSDPADERGARQLLAQTNSREAVLGEAEIEEGGDRDGSGAELLLLLDEVGSADESNGDLVAETGEEGEDLWRDALVWWSIGDD